MVGLLCACVRLLTCLLSRLGVQALTIKDGGDFQHILRILGTNVDGKQKVMYAMTSVKGIGRRFSNIVCKKADVDMDKRAGVSRCLCTPVSSLAPPVVTAHMQGIRLRAQSWRGVLRGEEDSSGAVAEALLQPKHSWERHARRCCACFVHQAWSRLAGVLTGWRCCFAGRGADGGGDAWQAS